MKAQLDVFVYSRLALFEVLWNDFTSQSQRYHHNLEDTKLH
jgi:hypothetical protein